MPSALLVILPLNVPFTEKVKVPDKLSVEVEPKAIGYLAIIAELVNVSEIELMFKANNSVCVVGLVVDL
jgi:hypothetical protein